MSSATYDTLSLETLGSVLVVTVDRPKRLNALSLEVLDDLLDLCHRLDYGDLRAAVRVVVLTGKGRAFCAGADLIANATGDGGRKWDSRRFEGQERFSRVITYLCRLPQPIIAGVNGVAVGGGMSLALACDVRVAGPKTKFNAAFIKIGLSGCELGSSFHLIRTIGSANAAYFLMTGDDISGAEAYRMGMVSHLVPEDDQILPKAIEIAQKMCATASTLGLVLTKKQIRATMDGGSLESVMHSEDTRQVLCLNDLPTIEEIKTRTARFSNKKPTSKM